MEDISTARGYRAIYPLLTNHLGHTFTLTLASRHRFTELVSDMDPAIKYDCRYITGAGSSRVATFCEVARKCNKKKIIR